jgi:hypothetical protein
VAASPHYAVLRQTSHISTGYPYTTSVDVNPRDARLDDTSSAAPVKLTVRPQRFAGPVRCWRPGWDTGSGRCGPDRESGHRGQQLAGKDGFMLDHLSIQCADVAASATFYDAVLPRSADAA